MANAYFQFKHFQILQEKAGMKVTTDACLFGAWVAEKILQMHDEPARILDIGGGTGLLSLMLAQVTENTIIEAVELNKEVATETAKNFKGSPWSTRLHSHAGEIQSFATSNTYDLIICNPPFFSNSQKGKQAAKNLALHDKQLPMDELIQSISRLLSKNGTCYLLFPEREMNAFTVKANSIGLLTHEYIYVKNEVDQPILRMMRGFGYNKNEVTASEIIIRKSDGKYTDTFWQLLKDYYLEYNNPKSAS